MCIRDRVNVRITGDPAGLNYLINYRSDPRMIMRLMSIPLLDFNPTSYELEPALAKALPVKKEVTEGQYKDLISFTFEILEEAIWDDGTPITGKDALFTIKAIYNPHNRSPYVGQFKIVNIEVEVDNPKKFTVYAEKYPIAEASIGTMELMPAHILDPDGVYDKLELATLMDSANKERFANDESLRKLGELFTSPEVMGHSGNLSGNGPYKLTKWITGQELVLERKQNWWGDKFSANPHLRAIPEKVIFKVVPDFNAAMSLMRNEEIDLVNTVPYAEFDRMKEDAFFQEKFNFYEPSMFRHGYLLMNNSSPKLNDKKVRRALAHLFDLEKIGETVFFGRKNQAATPIHPTKSYYRKDLPIIQYDVEKAKTLLQEAGWTDSNNNGIVDKMIDGSLQELNLEYLYVGGSSTLENIGKVFKEDARPAGVNIVLKAQDNRPTRIAQAQKKYELSVTSSSWYPLHKDLYQNWHSQGPTNKTAFGNVETDALIEEIQTTVDEDKLAILYSKIQEMIYEEQPVIVINIGTERIMVNKKMSNISTTSISPGFNLQHFGEAVPINVSNN